MGNKTPLKADTSTLEKALSTDTGKCPQHFHCTPQSLGFHSYNEYLDRPYDEQRHAKYRRDMCYLRYLCYLWYKINIKHTKRKQNEVR